MKTYDILIVGSGPAGLTAAIYARRADKSVLVLEKETFGGEITHSPKVENYPGFPVLSGNELAEHMMDHAVALGTEVDMDTVVGIEKGDVFTVKGEYNTYAAKAVIIAAGTKHRKLGLENEDKLVGHGISYCAVCDGPFYKGQSVAMIGGGNSALQEAIMLSGYCKHVTVVQNLAFLTGEKRLQEIIPTKENISIIYNTSVQALVGDKELTALVLRNTDGTVSDLPVDGAFVAIGQVPENEPFAGVCTLDERGYIVAGDDTLTGTDGVYAAGDCRTKAIRQVITAGGDGAVAALAAIRYTEDN